MPFKMRKDLTVSSEKFEMCVGRLDRPLNVKKVLFVWLLQK